MTHSGPAPQAPAPPWPAMLLTAGLGTRLRPLTRLSAKPALPVAGQPLVGRILRWLASAGVTDAVLNLHHLPATITAAAGGGQAHGLRVRYSWEPLLLGSAGGPARALPLLDAPRFYLINGDTLTDLDLAAMAAAHAASGALATLALVPNSDPAHYGGVSVDDRGLVTGFCPKGPANRGLHFIGVQIVEAEVFSGVDPGAPSQTIGGVYDDLIARSPGSVRAFLSRASFRDIGTAADYLATCLDLGRAPSGSSGLIDESAAVGPGAVLSRSVIWPGARIGSGACLDDCIVAGGAVVPAGAQYTRCVIRPVSTERDSFEREVGALLVSPLDVSRPRPAQD